MCFVDELEFNSRESRNLPLTMTHISSPPCSQPANVNLDFWELLPQFDDKGRLVKGVLKDIPSGNIIQTYVMEYEPAGNVVREVVHNFKDYPNIESAFLYNRQGKIYKIIQKFK